jgi:hypothetical protein
VTLADGEQCFLASVGARPGDGFVPHPEPADDLVVGTDGAVMVPRSGHRPAGEHRKVELLTRVRRGTRSTAGFILPATVSARGAQGDR